VKTKTLAWLLSVGLFAFPTLARAQAEGRPPRQFPEFVGTWTLDQSAGVGHIAGLPVARTVTIAITPTEISVIKDARTAEVYRIDGAESAATDLRTGAVLDRRYSFTLVAGALALTSKRTRERDGLAFTNIITDAYAVSGEVLIVERQLSVLVQPPGNLATLEDPNNNRQTLVYRRSR
jgi:hypothetical protein